MPHRNGESSTFDFVQDSVVVLDGDGIIRVWNTASESLYGWSREQAIGKEGRVLLGGGPVAHGHAVVVRETATGAQVTVEVRRTVERGDDGSPTRVLESGRDRTATSGEEAQHRLLEHRYANLFQAGSASLWEVDSSALDDILRTLLRAGITDFGTHLREHPEIVRRMMRAAIVVDVNDCAVALFGRGDKSELLGPYDRFWAPGSEDVFAAGVLRGVAKAATFSAETKLRSIDGRVFDALVTIRYPSATVGKGTMIISVTDLTAQKEADDAVRQSEYRYRNLFDAMGVAYLEIDFDRTDALLAELRASGIIELAAHLEASPTLGDRAIDGARVVDANEKAAELFAVRRATELTGSTTAIWTPESRRLFFGYLESRAKSLVSSSVELQLRTRDGGLVDVEMTAWTPPRRTLGARSLLALVDIGEGTRVPASISRRDTLYGAMFRCFPIALVECNVREELAQVGEMKAGTTSLDDVDDLEFVKLLCSRIVAVAANAEAVRLFNASSAEDLLGPVDWGIWRFSPQTFRRAINARVRGETFYTEETKVVSRDGQIVPVLYMSAFDPVLVEQGVSLVGFIDLREQARAQKMLETMRAELSHVARVSMLGELTASIAHEVSQPLAALLNSASAGKRWLDRPEPEIGRAIRSIERVVSETERAGAIIARVRSMAKKQAPVRAEVPINAVVQDALQFLHHESSNRGVTIGLELSAADPRVKVDRVQMQQVLVNLAVNAMQAMSVECVGDKVVTIRTELEEAVVRVSVEDRGPGIAKGDVERLFEGFFTTKETGMGMGLRICQSIVEAHDGAIAARNAPSGGAIFTFSLPSA